LKRSVSGVQATEVRCKNESSDVDLDKDIRQGIKDGGGASLEKKFWKFVSFGNYSDILQFHES